MRLGCATFPELLGQVEIHLLIPLGAMSYEDAVDAFAEQIAGLKEGGADVAWIETMSSRPCISAWRWVSGRRSGASSCCRP